MGAPRQRPRYISPSHPCNLDRLEPDEVARRAYTRFLGWYDLPDPSERHLVEEAQSALARLAGVKEVMREP